MYSVIEIAGHQYKVKKGDVFEINRVSDDENSEIVVSNVLATFSEDGKDIKIGAPYVEGATVKLKVVDHIKDEKIRVYKMKAKKRYRRNLGHRQPLSVVEVI